MYRPLPTSVSADEREHLILRHWKNADIFKRSVNERDGSPIFSFYEGPPTVNGMPGIHHVWSRTIKDTICRYKTMRGFKVERKGGWDTHGLPVEIAIEKELGFRHKHDIIKYGIGDFNEKCRESVYENIAREGGWKSLTERMAYWVDMENPYITCEPNYIESVWWALKKFWDADKIYKGYKIQPYCPRCETALSSHEVALGYDTAKDPSIYIKFEVDVKSLSLEILSNIIDEVPDKTKIYFMAWTTTPWTLISNVALAVNPDVDYVVARDLKKEGELYILAKDLVSVLGKEYEIIKDFVFKGSLLEYSTYVPLFGYNLHQHTKLHPSPGGIVAVEKQKYIVVLSNHVTTSDGTGIVHMAPAFGEEDYQVAQKPQYHLSIILPVDSSGNFVPAVHDDADFYPNLAGVFFKDADEIIIRHLKERQLIYKSEKIEHTYPFCWRCDTPLMYYARNSWYIRVTDYKNELFEKNKLINWNPPEIGEGRFGNWLSELKDWGISRERFWGTPLPIWESDDGHIKICIGSYADLVKEHEIEVSVLEGNPMSKFFPEDLDPLREEKKIAKFVPYIEGEQKGNSTSLIPITQDFLNNLDPHKPLIDKICFGATVGNTTFFLRRVPDVIDVWFDSGSMPFAQYHYMGEGEAGNIPLPPNYPAAYISEGIDQTRGWFYTLHAINTFLFGKPPYENVIVNDMLLDKNGQKMSKSRGNIVDPFEVIRLYGVDAVRWYLLASSVPWKPKMFNSDDIADVERKFFGTLLNTYGFFALYANIDNWTPGRRGEAIALMESLPNAIPTEMDRWILSKLNSLVKDCASWIDAYELTKPSRAIQDFVTEELSNWYVRRSRRRFWKGEMNADKQVAYDTLRECLLTVSKLMAPIAPYMSDLMYRSLVSDAATTDSVHLALYPTSNEKLIDSKLEARMAKAQIISSLVRQMRERAKIKVRQPLERLLIPCANRQDIEELRKVEEIILDEVNVKRIEYVLFGDSDVIKRKAKANFKALGARLGKQMKDVAARIGKMTDEEITRYEQQMGIEFDIAGENIKVERGEIDITAQDVEGWLVSSEGGVTVALDTHISAELQSEGLAREFVNRIQNLRKDSGFEVTDRITIAVGGAPEVLREALTKHENYIAQETLASKIISNGDSGEGSEIDLGELKAMVNIARV